MDNQKTTTRPILFLPLIALVAACGTLTVTIELPTDISPSQTLPPSSTSAPTLADTPAARPTEPVRSDWVHYSTDHYEISVPLASYDERICGDPAGALFPGMICIEPNEAFNNRRPLAATYMIQIVVSPRPPTATINDPASLFLNAPLGNSLYPEDFFITNTPIATNFDGERAYMLEDINLGGFRIMKHLLTIHSGKLYEIMVLPFKLTGDRFSNLPLVEEMLSTFSFIDLQQPTETAKLELDCSPAPSLFEVGRETWHRELQDLALKDDYALVASEVEIIVIGVTQEEVPFFAGSYELPENPRHISVAGDIAIVADPYSLYLFDVTNPAIPILRKQFEQIGVEEMLVWGQGLYLRDSDGIFWVYEISDEPNLAEIFVYDPPGDVLGGEIGGIQVSVLRQNARENSLPSFAITPDGVYLTDLDGGLTYIDMSGRLHIADILPIDLPFSPSDAVLIGRTIYVVSIDGIAAGRGWELWSLKLTNDVQKPEIRFLGAIDLPHGPTPETFCNFLADFYTLVGSDQPEAAISLPLITSLLHGVVMDDDHLYLVDQENFLRIFEID